MEKTSVGEVALASWGFMSVKAGCCAGGGGRSRLYGYGSPLRMHDISLAKSIQLGAGKSTERCTRRSIVSDSGSCCSDSEPKNQNMTVSYGPLSGF